MNIVSIKIKNFLSLVDVEIAPGKITQIAGDNGQGKTSILKALDFAVHGSNDPSLVRLGEDSAEVLVELSDSTIIRRRLNSQGRQNVDVTREGMKATSPQALLGALFDPSSFNPLELLDPKKRHEAIMKSIDLRLDAKSLAQAIGVEERELPPLDYTQHGLKVIDQCHAYFYQRRAEANRDAADKKKRWETYHKDFKAAEKPKMQKVEIQLRRQSCNDTIAQAGQHITRIATKNEALNVAAEKADRYRFEDSKLSDEAKELERQAANVVDQAKHDIIELDRVTQMKKAQIQKEAEAKKAELDAKIAGIQGRRESAKKFIEEAVRESGGARQDDSQFHRDRTDAERELAQLETAEKEIEAFEAVERQRQMIDGIKAEFEASEAFAAALDKRVGLLAGKAKKDLMAGAEMPIEGLAYEDGKFTVGGSSVDNLSTAAAMRLSVSVARKLAKKAKVICIDGAESLDSKTWAAFKKETKDDGFTYFVTKVGEPFVGVDHAMPGAESTVIMNQGQVMQ